MNSLEQELLSAIEDKLQTRYSSLKTCKNYKKKNITFYNSYEHFLNNLPKEDAIKFEKMFNLIFDLHSSENYVAYKAGFIDGLNIYETLKKN